MDSIFSDAVRHEWIERKHARIAVYAFGGADGNILFVDACFTVFSFIALQQLKCLRRRSTAERLLRQRNGNAGVLGCIGTVFYLACGHHGEQFNRNRFVKVLVTGNHHRTVN